MTFWVPRQACQKQSLLVSKWELDMMDNFPIHFPYGFGGPSQQRRTKSSATGCLSHYMELSLDQFKKGDFLLVCWNLVENMLADLSVRRMKCPLSDESWEWSGPPNQCSDFLPIDEMCALNQKTKIGMLVQITNLSFWEEAGKFCEQQRELVHAKMRNMRKERDKD